MEDSKRLKSLLSASEVLYAQLDLPVLLRRMMDIMAEVMESERGAIYLADQTTGDLALRAAQGADLAGLRIEKNPGARAYVAGKGVPVLIEDANRDPRWGDGAGAGDAKSALCVPLQSGNLLLGVAEVVNRKNGRSFDLDDLALFQGLSRICAAAISNSSRFHRVETENRMLKEKLDVSTVGIIGNSAAIRRILGIIQKVAPTRSTVLVTGESGTGKEVVARTLHVLSKCKNAPFMPLNCGALPETLLESELFGHEKGAFTGADKARPGIFEEAKGGTVFLDEIGETTLSTQVKLLRVLQEGRVKRVGSNREIPVDARILSATNQNLEELIKEKRFREDLFYRLNVVRIHVPALRERPEDIPVLADFFLKKAAAKLDKPLQGFAPEVLRIFYEYGWKGNVRELENAVESAVAMSDGPVIVPADLPGTLQGASAGSGLPGLSHLKYDDAFVFFEKAYFEALISQCDGDIHAAAEKAQVSEKSVYRRKQRFGL